MEWREIGPGTISRTFIGANKLQVTTKNGPPARDVYRRTVRDLDTGRIIDECVLDDTPDEILYR